MAFKAHKSEFVEDEEDENLEDNKLEDNYTIMMSLVILK